MAKKQNKNAREIDLSSFEFVKSCGSCHPGGGPAEYDRNGKRYDLYAQNPANQIVPGGDNNFDGDYFQSNWVETGVLEADCLLCHLPAYDYKERAKQIGAMNFRWAASAGAGLAQIQGAVASHETPQVSYVSQKFLPSGEVALPMVREIPAENCLNCHRETDWKKKGASYSHRTDVHLRAGLKCVDCHVTGRKASDDRIAGRENHDIGKGDDPTGLVRKDLDNTMRTCRDCHLKGLLKAPIPRHYGLPPIHLEKLACQTCHIPQRQAKAALLQDSTVFNFAPKIPAPGKRIWTFYGPDMLPWNLYGEANTFTAERQPLFTYEPVRARYKGKIYPMNRIDSIWMGIISSDQKVIVAQPYMKDLLKMWQVHHEDPIKNFPELGQITDDNQDGVPEANRPEEIQALVTALTRYLTEQGEPLAGRQVVLISGPNYTADGLHWQPLPVRPEPWEYTPYGSAFKLSHDIAPAASALGAGGCTDCHSQNAAFWTKPVMSEPFAGPSGRPVYISNAALLGLSPLGVAMGGIRHHWLEPLLFYGILGAIAALALFLVASGKGLPRQAGEGIFQDRTLRLMLGIIGVALAGPGVIILAGKLIPAGGIGALQNFHKIVALLFVLALLWRLSRGSAKNPIFFWIGVIGVLFMAITGGILLANETISTRQIVFTLHDAGAMLLSFLAALVFGLRFFLKKKALTTK